MMSFEETQKWGKRMRQEKEELENKMDKIHQAELRKKGINPNQPHVEEKFYSPNTLDKSEARIIYIALMILGAITTVPLLIWFCASLWYFGKDRP